MTNLLTSAAALAALLSADNAQAVSGSDTGNWQVEFTHVMYVTSNGYHRGPNSTHCVALSEDGAGPTKHSGGATVDGMYSGQFLVIGKTILITVGVPSGNAEVATWIFSSNAKGGDLGKAGSFDNELGGQTYSEANAIFGARGSC